jgi:hypothetical protein
MARSGLIRHWLGPPARSTCTCIGCIMPTPLSLSPPLPPSPFPSSPFISPGQQKYPRTKLPSPPSRSLLRPHVLSLPATPMPRVCVPQFEVQKSLAARLWLICRMCSLLSSIA